MAANVTNCDAPKVYAEPKKIIIWFYIFCTYYILQRVIYDVGLFMYMAIFERNKHIVNTL